VVPVVRETAAQALGMAAQPLDTASLCRLLQLLFSLQHHRNWHVRHGALVRAQGPGQTDDCLTRETNLGLIDWQVLHSHACNDMGRILRSPIGSCVQALCLPVYFCSCSAATKHSTLASLFPDSVGIMTNNLPQPRATAKSGVKYLLAARPDAVGSLLPLALPVLSEGLADREDAVQAAAADALAPVAAQLLDLDRGVRRGGRRGPNGV
jgi:hypothetical protein